MPLYSISDIGRSIVAGSDPYSREMGAFSAFLSPERRAAFHRINVEYLQSVSVSHLSNIQNLLYNGFTYNLQAMQGIQHDLSFIKNDVGVIKQYSKVISEGVEKVITGLDKTNEILSKILDVVSNPSSTASLEKASLARINIVQAKKLEPDKAAILLDEAYSLLVDSISKSPINYKAYFDKGWLESFYYQDYDKAIDSFDNAVIRSIENDNLFCVQALRYLADTYSIKGNYTQAISCIEKAISLNCGDKDQLKLEYAQYLLNNREEGKAIQQIKKTINNKASSFTYFSTDPIILLNRESKKCLSDLYDECKQNMLYSARGYYQPKDQYDLVIDAKVRPRIMLKNINIPLKKEVEKDKRIKIGVEDQESLFSRFFINSLDRDVNAIDYISLREKLDNENNNVDFLENWAKKSAKSLFYEKGYKDAQIKSVSLEKRKKLFGKLSIL